MEQSAYLSRMRELEETRYNRYEGSRQSEGLPINRPQNGSPSGVPTSKPQMPQEDESYKQSTFYQNFDNFKQNDPYFGGVMDELTSLATGLREQVSQGYMPKPIAEQRLRQFIQDSSSHYQKNKKSLGEKAQAEKDQEQIEGILSQFSGPSQPQELPPEGISQDQAAEMGGQ